jgi:hypothetical protein
MSSRWRADRVQAEIAAKEEAKKKVANEARKTAGKP